MDRRTRPRAGSSAQPLGVPLRPELVEFLDAKSLCHYTACSKACGKDARDVNAWQLLANVNAQVPLTAKDASESHARSRVRSQVRRRLIADALADPSTWDGSQRFEANRFEDFTFFLRLQDGDRLIWEGDLQASPDASGDLRLPLAQVWTEIKKSGTWTQMADLLAQTEDARGLQVRDTQEFMQRLRVTLIAIRDVDQATVPLGHFFWYDDQDGADSIIMFHAPRGPGPDYVLFHAPTFVLRPEIGFELTHDPSNGGTLGYLNVEFVEYRGSSEDMYGEVRGELTPDCVRLILTYNAGVPPVRRAQLLHYIRTWGHEEDSDDDSDYDW